MGEADIIQIFAIYFGRNVSNKSKYQSTPFVSNRFSIKALLARFSPFSQPCSNNKGIGKARRVKGKNRTLISY